LGATNDSTENSENFEVLSVGELRKRYREQGVRAEPVEFDETEVPDSLKHLIPLARIYGIGEDLLREDLVEAAGPAAIRALKQAVAAVDAEFDSWLTSPDALARMSPAHLAFSNLRMAADLA
jgi:hypothetical protein